jgi:hypothetical protein
VVGEQLREFGFQVARVGSISGGAAADEERDTREPKILLHKTNLLPS